MTRLIEKIIEQLRAVPEGQQDQLAEFLLHELAEDEHWASTTRANAARLKGLIDEVLADDKAARTTARTVTAVISPAPLAAPIPSRNFPSHNDLEKS